MNREELIGNILTKKFENYGKSLENIKAMLEDLVLAVPSPPGVDKLVRSIMEALPEEEAPPAETPAEESAQPKAAAAFLNNRLLYHVAGIEYANSQGKVLNQLLEGVRNYAQRAVIFVVRNNEAQAWNAFGFDEADEAKRWKTAIDTDPLLQTLAGSRTRLLMDNTVPSFIPARQEVKRSMLTPLILKGKVLAFLYADSGTMGMLDHYSIDILTRTASLVIDIFPLHSKRDPLPPTLEEQAIIEKGASPLESAAEESEENLLFEDSGTLASQSKETDLPVNQTVMAQIPSEIAAERTVGDVEVEEPEAEAEEPEVEGEEASAPEMDEESAVREAVELESGDYETPDEENEAEEAPEVEAEAPAEEEPIPPEEEKAHNDAQRFARLLVQEIALYHPDEVARGKRKHNLYALLKNDIERSREAYRNRFRNPSIASRDYFNKALVAHLADGDASLLGN